MHLALGLSHSVESPHIYWKHFSLKLREINELYYKSLLRYFHEILSRKNNTTVWESRFFAKISWNQRFHYKVHYKILWRNFFKFKLILVELSCTLQCVHCVTFDCLLTDFNDVWQALGNFHEDTKNVDEHIEPLHFDDKKWRLRNDVVNITDLQMAFF